MGEFGHDAGVTPLLFFDGHTGIFNDHRESGPRFNVSSEVKADDKPLQWTETFHLLSLQKEKQLASTCATRTAFY